MCVSRDETERKMQREPLMILTVIDPLPAGFPLAKINGL